MRRDYGPCRRFATECCASRMAMLVEGAMTLGGGLPRVTLSRMEWVISGSGSLPETVTVSGRLVRGSEERTFSFQVLVDD